MRKSAGKIVVLLLIIGSCVFILKTRAKVNGSDASERALVKSVAAATDTSIFFIGSSRVQKSIDPEIIHDHFPEFSVFNLGISGGNFLSNCVMADYIIQQRGHKILFIELALLLDELPEGIFNFSSLTGLSPSGSVLSLTEGRSFPERSILLSNVINYQLHSAITIGDEVRSLAGYKKSQDAEKWIGFDPYDKRTTHSANSFLTWQEIDTSVSNSSDLTKYRTAINYLETHAKNNNARVIFFLPITCRTEVEKNSVIQLYHELPDSMKLEFSTQFLKEMAREEYLGDANHLNKKGATTYSNMLVPLVKNVFEKQTAKD